MSDTQVEEETEHFRKIALEVNDGPLEDKVSVNQVRHIIRMHIKLTNGQKKMRSGSVWLWLLFSFLMFVPLLFL